MSNTTVEYVGKNVQEHKVNSKWWEEDQKEIWKSVNSIFRQIESNQLYRRQKNNNLSRLYGNMPSVGLGVNPYNIKMQNELVNGNRLTCNVIKMCIDTLVSKIATLKPRPFFLTERGDWTQQRRAKKLTSFFEGLYDELGFYKIKQMQFKDACIFDSGFIKFYVDKENEKICVERVLPDEVMVDDTEGLYNNPRQMFHKKLVSREILLEMFPKNKSEIQFAKRAEVGETGAMTKSDLVVVVEAWHLRSSKNAKDGKHTICIDGCTLYSGEYKKDYFPIQKYSWGHRPYGFYGCGVAEDLVGYQLDINKSLKTIQAAQHLLAVPRIWIENNSDVNTAYINNEVGSIGKYKGTMPVFYTPTAMNAEIYNHVETQIRRSFDQVGLSMMTATSQKPVGLNSGKALRTYNAIETERFKAQSMDFEDSFMSDTQILIDLCNDLAELKKDFGTKAGKKAFQSIKWKDVKMEQDQYILRKYPTSFLPATPEGKMETVQELINNQLIPREHALDLLDFPDLDSVTSLVNSSRDTILRIIELILDEGEYETPEPYFDLNLAVKLSQEAYLRAKNENAPSRNLELLRIFNQDCLELIKLGLQQQQAQMQAMSAPVTGAEGSAVPMPQQQEQIPPIPQA